MIAAAPASAVEFSRREFLKTGGALIVSFSFGLKFAGLASAQDDKPKLPSGFRKSPLLDSWIRLNSDGTVRIFTGKVEYGQGIKTALAQIGAEELDVDVKRVTIITADTGATPDEGGTVGSNSVEQSGANIRQAAADARLILLERAAATLNVPVDKLHVTDGTVSATDGAASVTYWTLIADDVLHREADGRGKPKNAESYNIVGTSVPRIDVPAKVLGAAAFLQDIRLPGMLHGRVVRPPSYGAVLIEADVARARKQPGVVAVVRDGSYLAVIAAREEQAIRAMERLKASAKWRESAELPAPDKIYDFLTGAKTIDSLIVDGVPSTDAIPPLLVVDGAKQVQASYRKPYIMHAAVGPSAALAQLTDGKLTVWTHSQTIFPLRETIAMVLKMKREDVRCIHAEGAGCYGHNAADDAALDAALLARAVPGRPVRVQWMRDDEHKWEPYGAAMLLKLHASLDDGGNVVAWNSDLWSTSHGTRPSGRGPDTELSPAWFLADAHKPASAKIGDGRHSEYYRNADPLYTFERRRVVSHFVREMPVRVSATRALGAYANVFAIESFMDELAHAAGADPIEFRLRHLGDERARAVVTAVAHKASWAKGPPVRGDGNGRGVAFAQYKNEKCYVAVIVDVAVDRATGNIQLRKAVIAGDAGQIINPDGLANQLEGGFIQAASWTLKEQVSFDRARITSTDWRSYPVLGFGEVPEIETVLINRPGKKSLGSGEAAQGPAPAAIANAVYNAVGVRLRETPFRPARLKAAFG